MADQSTKGGGTVPWQTIIALMAAFGGAAFFLSNLSSSRPDNPAPNWATSVSYQDTPARLWQDPFGLISSPGPNSNASSGTSILSFANDGRSHKTKEMIDEMNEHLGHTIVLPVLVPGQPYAELVERRLRTRVAVSEALVRCGYLPEDGEHLGYFMTPWHWKPLNAKESNTLVNNLSPATKADKRDVPLVVPFEWYSAAIFRSTAGAQLPPQGALYDHILVLWISEDAITDYPLARLAVLRDLLTQKDFFGNRTGAPPQFHIIGPWASNTLRSMVIEAHSLWNPPDPDLLSDVMMYSSTATASEAFLLHPDSPSFDPQPYGKSVADVLKAQTGLSLFRITQTDDVLCKSLVDELNLRIHPDICQNEGLAATPDEGPPNIAVISEWDTVYGRALPLAFAAAARGVSEDEIRRTPDLETHFPNIRYFSYLRGIDGKTPLAANSLQTPPDNSANAQNQTKSTSSANKFEDYAEAPEGTNQTDYLRRLADRLADWDSILRTSKGQRLDAVGFFGTDVYDELLIARALRDKLPNVIFFTTSMDARLTLPSEWRAAHNLVIVSSFGERLDSYIQGNIPPFRDGYETASFTATLTALGALPAPQNPTYGGNQVCSVLGNPRRFEVGRQGFYDLTVRDDDELDQDNALLQQRYVNAPPDAATTPKIIQPPRTDYEAIYFLIDWSPVMRFLGLIGLLAVLIFAFGVRPDKIHPGRIFWQTYFWVFLALAVAAFIVILGSKADGDRGAPLALFDGLSPWPTEVFRVLAIGLCVGLISSAHQAMKENDRDLAELLSFDNAPPQKLVPPKSLPAIQTGHWLQEVIIPLWIHIGNWRVYWLGGKLIASPRPTNCRPMRKSLRKTFGGNTAGVHAFCQDLSGHSCLPGSFGMPLTRSQKFGARPRRLSVGASPPNGIGTSPSGESGLRSISPCTSSTEPM